MAEHNETGKKGEDIATVYLTENGYRILERNWRYQHLEIDIIAAKGNELVIAEVKCRTGNPVAEPYVSVTRRKQHQLIKAAGMYIQENEMEMEVRFDVISIIIGNQTIIEHIENAFYPIAGK
ncbi:MAG: YraN family protein [Bacteroidales bacterium]|jgi:putative endonuclease|nr:YraN family protein [Bacteroidales bacterium]